MKVSHEKQRASFFVPETHAANLSNGRKASIWAEPLRRPVWKPEREIICIDYVTLWLQPAEPRELTSVPEL